MLLNLIKFYANMCVIASPHVYSIQFGGPLIFLSPFGISGTFVPLSLPSFFETLRTTFELGLGGEYNLIF